MNIIPVFYRHIGIDLNRFLPMEMDFTLYSYIEIIHGWVFTLNRCKSSLVSSKQVHCKMD